MWIPLGSSLHSAVKNLFTSFSEWLKMKLQLGYLYKTSRVLCSVLMEEKRRTQSSPIYFLSTIQKVIKATVVCSFIFHMIVQMVIFNIWIVSLWQCHRSMWIQCRQTCVYLKSVSYLCPAHKTQCNQFPQSKRTLVVFIKDKPEILLPIPRFHHAWTPPLLPCGPGQ